MAESMPDRIITLIDQTLQLYHHLIVVVAPTRSGKTTALREVTQRYPDATYLNLNLVLSERLLPLTRRQRALQTRQQLENVLKDMASRVVLLDNTELLFDPTLKLQPLSLLTSISRNRTVVVSWNGIVEQNYLVYARPGHPEYRRYPINDFLVVSPEPHA